MEELMQLAPSFGPDEGLQIGQGRLTQSLDIGYVLRKVSSVFECDAGHRTKHFIRRDIQ